MSQTIETTSQADEHGKHKRKSRKKLENELVQGKVVTTCEGESTLCLEKDFKVSSDNIKINPWISEQAKLVLAVGRSCAALNAVYSRDDQIKDKSLKASDVLKQNASTKVNESKLSIREEYLKKYQENINSGGKKGRLRERFSHLLGSTSTETKHSSGPSKDAQPKSPLRYCRLQLLCLFF